MSNKISRVMAGEVLTANLLKRIDKAAYQYGGLQIEGKRSMSVVNGKIIENLPTVTLHKKHIKGSVENFLRDFSKTMNAHTYNLKIAD